MKKPREIVKALIDQHHLSETKIVEELKTLGVSTSQPTINRIKNGTTESIDYEVGSGLSQLLDNLSQAEAR